MCLLRKFLIIFITCILTLSFLPSSERVLAANTNIFPYGMFEDGNMTHGETSVRNMITDLRNHGMDTILFTNNYASRMQNGLTVADELNFNVVFAPHGDLSKEWWSTNSATLENARIIGYNIVDKVKSYKSLIGYNLKDDTPLSDASKAALMTQAFQEYDPNRIVTTVLVGNHEKVYTEAGPDVFLTYTYPATQGYDPCDFTAYSHQANTFEQRIRQILRWKDISVPAWLILQAHGGEDSTKRTPTVEEVRLQNWIALGEGVKGIFWFIYKTQQFWTGLLDNQSLYNEITDLAYRTEPLRPLLLTLDKTDDLFAATSAASLSWEYVPYASTLSNSEKNKFYIIVANKSCSQQDISISTEYFSAGKLKDMETGEEYKFNERMAFRGGDGKMFEVIDAVRLPEPEPEPILNLLQNPSFEESNSGSPTSWGLRATSSLDTTIAHSGGNSLKVTGPASFTYSAVTLNLKPNTLYSYHYWVKADNITGKGLSTRYVSLNPSEIMPQSESVTGTTDWKRISRTFYTPDNHISGRFDLTWELDEGDIGWFDDFEFCEGDRCFYLPETRTQEEHQRTTLTSIFASTTSSTAILTWLSDEQSSSRVMYGLTTRYGTWIDEADMSPRVTNHSVKLDGLTACTTYHYRVESTNTEGYRTLSDDHMFTTTGCAGHASILDQSRVMVASSTGRLLGLLNNNNGIQVNVPINYASTDADFQIKQLDKNDMFLSIGKPSGYTEVSNYLYELKALTGNSTTLSEFEKDITVTFSYDTTDIEGLDESMLSILRWDGLSWNRLSGCTVSTLKNTISCPTRAFSVFGLFGFLPSTNSPSVSSLIINPMITPCVEDSPVTAPDLFQIQSIDTVSTLYFAPPRGIYNSFVIRYGISKDFMSHSVSFDHRFSHGVLSYSINNLLPNTKYYFQVRAFNNCQPGLWSNILETTTTTIPSLLYFSHRIQSLNYSYPFFHVSDITNDRRQNKIFYENNKIQEKDKVSSPIHSPKRELIQNNSQKKLLTIWQKIVSFFQKLFNN